MEKVTIYHNPKCGTSRNTLALIRHLGIEPTIIHYLETPPDEATLRNLITEMGICVRDLLRTNVPPYEALNLSRMELSDDELIASMLAEPILINRPIVITSKGVRLCRPSEKFLEISPVSLDKPFIKEDGGVIEL
ncbi:arsenate reductase (glutaredoxin) [Actinobacillus pleuropneumoniae]|uniref:Arsenate reductase n=1 Tax=Actinobacillus pleuropneumoniae serotype 7 (strain AP76) TaxID=537457 RepID=B3H1X2_ACTP7|nr:arsenate reductase (glutaredoxin) [Actinobacillus pleuropneumoniae]ACE61799.1 arsenate reductase [Actinobacillus pleuropneumoniae serovar 7 str. AP76]EFN02618.1 Arsenate reductase [Actinobacillus pleuropneumoniae serovar 13 str. N273]MBT9319039.1 arsenate reductase (glutaredoxin) [Actinobacillus pleuropneumoniae]MBT9343955.1 arsenate reductase (glutaredoxin) [Actinobacillus pleuropneumoniae]UKH16598.1 arsenate reductase (glutaredoxin) [Actinobacillus pleuropneumoniae]